MDFIAGSEYMTKQEEDVSIAHFCQMAPQGSPHGTSGMYLCVKDQIKYERRLGFESILIDPNIEFPEEINSDGWLKTAPWAQAKKQKIWVLHRSYPGQLNNIRNNHGCIAILHGPAMQMMTVELKSHGNTGNFNTDINLVWNYDRAVALCPNDFEIMRLYDEGGKLMYIQDAIDTEEFSVKGFKWEYTGKPAIIMSDTVRDTKFPAHMYWAMPEIDKRIPGARLQVFGFSRYDSLTYRNLMMRSKNQMISKLTETIVYSGLSDLRPFLRGADIGFINEINGRAGRTVPEKMASGIPVVSYDGDYTKYHAKAWNTESIADAIEKCWKDTEKNPKKMRNDSRKYALNNFSMEKKVEEEYVPLYREVIEEKGL